VGGGGAVVVRLSGYSHVRLVVGMRYFELVRKISFGNYVKIFFGLKFFLPSVKISCNQFQ